jgi:predicted transcriptional regulator
MSKSLTEMAAEIVAAQASHVGMSHDEVGAALRKAFEALQSIKAIEDGAAASVEEALAAMDPRASIQRNKVICLECCKEFKQITNRHLKDHGMNAKEYRKKYGFSARQPLSAKALTAKRRNIAKRLGLGERLQAARRAKAGAAEKRTRKAGTRKKA